jgi:hypothetical protein
MACVLKHARHDVPRLSAGAVICWVKNLGGLGRYLWKRGFGVGGS